MVSAFRRGMSLGKVAKKFGVAKATVWFWVRRAEGKRLDRVDFRDRTSGPQRPANRTAKTVEACVLEVRQELREISDLGEFGAEAILDHMTKLGCAQLPSRATVNRILRRHGAVLPRQRQRRTPPPRGWYLPDVAKNKAELDSMDYVEDLCLEGGCRFHVLNVISINGSLIESWPMPRMTSENTIRNALDHWRRHGLPRYAQFDNGMVFYGSRWPDSLGKLTRICLQLGITPVFAPPREMGFQSAIENYNGRWQRAVHRRFHFADLDEVIGQSTRYVTAVNRKHALRQAAAPPRRDFPANRRFDPRKPPRGKVIFLCRTDEDRCVSVMGHRWELPDADAGQLVRATLTFAGRAIHFHGLRRSRPADHDYLGSVDYTFPVAEKPKKPTPKKQLS